MFGWIKDLNLNYKNYLKITFRYDLVIFDGARQTYRAFYDINVLYVAVTL